MKESLRYDGKRAIRPSNLMLYDCHGMFPYHVHVGGRIAPPNLRYGYRKWCDEYCQGYYMVIDVDKMKQPHPIYPPGTSYLFDDKRDAVMFKLKFYQNG